MAQYKYSSYLKQLDNDEYDKTYTPGQNCPNSGIYRCETCGDEIASNLAYFIVWIVSFALILLF